MREFEFRIANNYVRQKHQEAAAEEARRLEQASSPWAIREQRRALEIRQQLERVQRMALELADVLRENGHMPSVEFQVEGQTTRRQVSARNWRGRETYKTQDMPVTTPCWPLTERVEKETVEVPPSLYSKMHYDAIPPSATTRVVSSRRAGVVLRPEGELWRVVGPTVKTGELSPKPGLLNLVRVANFRDLYEYKEYPESMQCLPLDGVENALKDLYLERVGMPPEAERAVALGQASLDSEIVSGLLGRLNQHFGPPQQD